MIHFMKENLINTFLHEMAKKLHYEKDKTMGSSITWKINYGKLRY